MKQRGFTIVELLVSIGVLMTVLALVYSGVRPQAQRAGEITRQSRMQAETRGAFDLMARDLRMAGYGIDLTMPGVPGAGDPGRGHDLLGQLHQREDHRQRCRLGGDGRQRRRLRGAELSRHRVAPLRWRGARLIAGVSANTVVLATPLSRAYSAGSAVHQLEPVRYAINGSQVMLRNSQAALTGRQHRHRAVLPRRRQSGQHAAEQPRPHPHAR